MSHVAKSTEPVTSADEVPNIMRRAFASLRNGRGDPAVVALEFVSEDDVRSAVSDGRKLPVSPATVITPSARELGNEHSIFVRV